MATPSRAQDPTAAALSAIEEALNLGDPAAEEKAAADQAAGRAAEAAGTQAEGEAPLAAGVQLPKARTTPIDDWSAPNLTEGVGEHAPAAAVVGQPAVPPRAAGRDAPLAPSVPAANENRQSVGAILQAMRVRPSPAPLVAALLLSIVWAGICAAYLAGHRELLVPADGVPLYRRPELGVIALGVFGPIIFMFVTALMARRANEMRMTARSMTEVAIRLAEPETVATEQVVSLSQAIRREVASLGDGIERALARASELETMMRAEVSNLERSYSDNERRIRSLIDGLSQQREEIVINSEKVRTAIVGAHESLARSRVHICAPCGDGQRSGRARDGIARLEKRGDCLRVEPHWGGPRAEPVGSWRRSRPAPGGDRRGGNHAGQRCRRRCRPDACRSHC